MSRSRWQIKKCNTLKEQIGGLETQHSWLADGSGFDPDSLGSFATLAANAAFDKLDESCPH